VGRSSGLSYRPNSSTHRLMHHAGARGGSKATQLGGLTPHLLARLLMWELSNETECCG
jgi:hypothetical protein